MGKHVVQHDVGPILEKKRNFFCVLTIHMSCVMLSVSSRGRLTQLPEATVERDAREMPELIVPLIFICTCNENKYK
jgi:hypothetical protein